VSASPAGEDAGAVHAHPHTSQPTPTPTINWNVRIMPMPTASPLRSGIALWASSEAGGVSGMGFGAACKMLDRPPTDKFANELVCIGILNSLAIKTRNFEFLGEKKQQIREFIANTADEFIAPTLSRN